MPEAVAPSRFGLVVAHSGTVDLKGSEEFTLLTHEILKLRVFGLVSQPEGDDEKWDTDEASEEDSPC